MNCGAESPFLHCFSLKIWDHAKLPKLLGIRETSKKRQIKEFVGEEVEGEWEG